MGHKHYRHRAGDAGEERIVILVVPEQ